MFAVTVNLKVKPGSVEAFRKAVLQHAKNSLEKEEACRRFDVCFDDDRPERIFLYEVYDDGAAFDLHRESDHYERFNEITSPLLDGRSADFWTLQTPV